MEALVALAIGSGTQNLDAQKRMASLRPHGAQTAQTATPAASSSPPDASGPSLSGYMDLHFNKPTDAPGTLDFHRFVLLIAHRFSDRVRFVSELELAHGVVEGLEKGGELELEQAYLDFLVRPAFNLRAGMILAPVGIINERHEPPIFYGVERPFVDTVIIPTTWFDVGVGAHGDLGGGFRYRGYLMAPLDATAFTPEEGLQGASQHGNRAQVRNVAWTGRLEYVGTRGLQLGLSGWRGETGFNLPRIKTDLGLIEFDARVTHERLEARAQYAHAFIGGARSLNDALTRLTGIDPNIARQIRGSYAEVAYRVLPASAPHAAAVFVRYENFDTQFRMPTGAVPLPQFDRSAWVAGATYWIDPDVAVKFDYSHVRNRSESVPAPRSINIGLGWWF